MKKSTMRVLSLVMAIMMIVGTLAAVPFSAYDPTFDQQPDATNVKHVHKTTEEGFVKNVPATCTLYGYDVYECPDCGEQFATNITDKLEGHKYVEVGEVDGNCLTGEAGHTAGVMCELCGHVKTGCTPIAAEHEIAYRIVDGLYNFDEDGEYFTTADCVEGVTYQKYCNKCGAILEDRVNIIVDGEGAHEFSAKLEEPYECGKEIYLTVYCTDPADYIIFDDCKYEGPVKVSVGTLEHNWVIVYKTNAERAQDAVATAQAPIDPIDGSYYRCTRCGEEKEIPEGDTSKSGCHVWVSDGLVYGEEGSTRVSSKDATSAAAFLQAYAKVSCTYELDELFHCTVCGTHRTVTRVEKVGHQYGTYTFKFIGKVEIKNGFYEYTEEQPFSYQLVGNVTYTYKCGDSVTITKTCACCGEAETTTGAIQNHNIQEHWICKNAECAIKDGQPNNTIELTIAGIDGKEKFIATLPEGYYNCGDCTHAHQEKICIMPAGDLKVFYNYTKVVTADYRTPETDPLKEIEVKAGEYTTQFLFEVDETPAANITYDESELKVCVGEIDLKVREHIFGNWKIVKEGDCQTEKEKRAVCKRCYKEYGDNVKTGIFGDHVMSNWEYIVAPTCVKPSEQYSNCTVCHNCPKVETLAIDPDNHEDARLEKTVESTCTVKGHEEWKCYACGKEWTVTLELAPHNFDRRDPVEANCFDSGLKEYAKCKVCGYFEEVKDNDGNVIDVHDGAYIPAFNHNLVDVKRQGLDKVQVATYTFNKNNDNFRYVNFALGIRAFKVEENKQTGDVTYYVNYVAPTCAKDGYIIGEYCTLCAERWKKSETEDPTIFHQDDATAQNSCMFSGYKLPNDGFNHNFVTVSSNNVLPLLKNCADGSKICGRELDYTYNFEYCTVCGLYKNVTFDHFTAMDHKPDYKKNETTGAYEKDEDGEYIMIEDIVVLDDEDGYVKLTEDNESDYPDCTYKRYTAKVCRFCGEYYDFEELNPDEPDGHYLINVNGAKTIIMGACNAYDPQYVGLTCFACGKKVPYYETVEIEEGEYVGLSDEYYYDRKDGKEITDLTPYLTLDHVWIEDLDCEKADIMECAICGIKVLNEEKEVRGYHEYLLRNDEEKAYDKFDLKTYDFYDYAYTKVVLSTPSKLGYGVLECIHCGKELKVDAPALSATFTAAYDDPTDVVNNVAIKNVLVGDTVTVTIKVTAGEFKFSELNFDIRLLPNYFELLDAEVLYDFGAADKVDHNISYKQGEDEDADITFTCVGIDRDATIKNAKNADFLRLTFKVGEFTRTREVTTYTGGHVAGINTITAKTVDAEAASTIQEDTSFGEINIYNPNYSSTDSVLTAIYGDRNAAQYDFNKDGIVDLVDYDMLASYASSAKTVWDFYTLIGYDIEGMLDSLDYTNVSYGYGRTFENGVETIVPGTEGDIIVAKEKIRTTLKSTAYANVIGTQTIVDLAKSVIA